MSRTVRITIDYDEADAGRKIDVHVHVEGDETASFVLLAEAVNKLTPEFIANAVLRRVAGEIEACHFEDG